jgi:predicted small metal-binding protein
MARLQEFYTAVVASGARSVMDRVMRGECGYEVSSDAEVVGAAQAHAWDAHGMEVSAQLARGLSRPETKRPQRSVTRDESR